MSDSAERQKPIPSASLPWTARDNDGFWLVGPGGREPVQLSAEAALELEISMAQARRDSELSIDDAHHGVA